MRIHFSNGSHMPRKTQLLTTTAMSLAIAVGFAVLHPSAGYAQEILTFRDGDAQTPGTWDDNDNDFLDADNNVEDFDDGDFVNFGSASTLIQITRDLRPGSITFDTGGGTSVLSTAQSEGNLSINDSRDFEVNPGDTLDFNVVNGTLELRVDVVTTDGTSNSTIRVNADGTSTGELAVIEDFFGDVEVFDGTLSLNSGLNEEGVARDASVRGVLRVENGVVNNNADVFGIARVGALAGSVVLSQSLIGAVINRPSSPFVNGLAYDDENPCGAGGWARAIGGTADASGRIDQTGDTQNVSFESEISADYYGIQVGGDYACFNGYYNGWDIATGGIAGVNQGSSSQPIFAFDPNTLGSSTDTIIATTDVDFNQVYAGVYGTAVRDRFAAELQYRFEATDFTANNDASGSLQLTDAEFGSDSNTFSGSFSYALSVPNTELTFVPVTGFAYTQISPDEITFDDGGVVTIEDFTSEVLFVGGTLSRTKFGDDGTTALNQFVTATYYNEMADDPVSNYVTADGLNRSEVTTENLGAYTELSVGMNYVKILDEGNSFNAKQLSASARADVRMSDQLESWGLTAQVRLQF